MIFRWLQKRRRRQLRSKSFPHEWEEIIRRNVRFVDTLLDTERDKMCGDLQILVAEKNWEGCGGLQMTEEIQVTIAAQACQLILGLQEEYFDRVQSVLVYPGSYVAPDHRVAAGNILLEGQSAREGEAWYRGPVILSWPETLAGARHQAHSHNLVLHEFAHQLDMQCGEAVDGMPCLETPAEVQRWRKVMSREYRQLVRDCQQGRPTLLDCYGTTNEAEFFAVATECFFQRPIPLRDRHSLLYAVLRDYYRQDPAERRPR